MLKVGIGYFELIELAFFMVSVCLKIVMKNQGFKLSVFSFFGAGMTIFFFTNQLKLRVA